MILDVLMDTAYPVGRQDRHFYLRLFLLLRKASNAITRLPKAHNNVNMPMKIERLSKAVIHATSLPMYSGKPVIWCWEATTLSWALSYGSRHANNISFFLSQFNIFRQIICVNSSISTYFCVVGKPLFPHENSPQTYRKP